MDTWTDAKAAARCAQAHDNKVTARHAASVFARSFAKHPKEESEYGRQTSESMKHWLETLRSSRSARRR